MMLADVSGVRRSEKGRLADANDADSCRGARVVFDQLMLLMLADVSGVGRSEKGRLADANDADSCRGAGGAQRLMPKMLLGGVVDWRKERIFLDYADLEMRLGNIDRCRTIYSKFLEVQPHNPKAWTVFVDLEDSVGEVERARALCNLAVTQERLDMPELVWKRYIDLETMELLLLLFPTMGRLKKKRKLRNLLIHGIKSLLTGRSKQDVLTQASLLAFETSGGRPTLQAAEPGGQGEIVMMMRKMNENQAIEDIPDRQEWMSDPDSGEKLLKIMDIKELCSEDNRDDMINTLVKITNTLRRTKGESNKAFFARMALALRNDELKVLLNFIQGKLKTKDVKERKAPKEKAKESQVDLNYFSVLDEQQAKEILVAMVKEQTRNHKRTFAACTSTRRLPGATDTAEMRATDLFLDYLEYLDFKVSQSETDNARKVWQMLLSKSHHVRVYIAYSDFEAVTCQSMAKAREALDAGSRHFKVESRSEERAMLLEHLLKLEKEHGDEESVQAAEKKQPQRVKKRKAIQGEDGQEAFEEYMDYNFPEDSSETQNLKILEMARMWKKREVEPDLSRASERRIQLSCEFVASESWSRSRPSLLPSRHSYRVRGIRAKPAVLGPLRRPGRSKPRMNGFEVDIPLRQSSKPVPHDATQNFAFSIAPENWANYSEPRELCEELSKGNKRVSGLKAPRFLLLVPPRTNRIAASVLSSSQLRQTSKSLVASDGEPRSVNVSDQVSRFSFSHAYAEGWSWWEHDYNRLLREAGVAPTVDVHACRQRHLLKCGAGEA
ncbi:CRNKL1 [Symbiodinium microadriaticum]|nr:CRNKL1 [Symbiodinium microadriaticum]